MEPANWSTEESEYERTLIIPKQPKRKLFLLCTIGLVGAGKTTVVKPLAERLSLIRISGDEIRKILKDRKDSYEAVGDIAWSLIGKYLKLGYSIAIDSDCARPFSQQMITKMQEKYHALPVWIRINTPEEVILHRLRMRRSWLFKDGEEAVKNYMTRKHLHENLQHIPFVYMFDTSHDNLSQQIDEAIALIEGKIRN